MLGICFILLLALLNGCASLPDNSERSISHAYDNGSELKDKYHVGSASHPDGESAFYLLGNGLDAFVGRALLARSAQHSIDTQYYLIHSDEVGSLFINELWKAADRGVKIRLILDDIDEGSRDFSIAIFAAHPNIEVRIFNPFGRNVSRLFQYVSGFGKQTRRAHNKSFTVDNIATVLGGRNVGDEYFSADPDLAFQDLDVVGVGPVANQVSSSFDEYWNSPFSYPITLLLETQPGAEDILQGRDVFRQKISGYKNSEYVERLMDSPLANSFHDNTITYNWATASVYADKPDKLSQKVGAADYLMIQDLKPYMNKARNELIIISPYFVPGKEGTKFLIKLQQRGVQVRVLTNSLSSTDVSVVHAGYSRYRKDLLKAGVELYELNEKTSKAQRKARSKGSIGQSKSSLHAKAFIVDRSDVFIGSLNLDPRSVIQNTEIGMVIQSTEIAEKLANIFNTSTPTAAFQLKLENKSSGKGSIEWHGRDAGKAVIYTKDPHTSFWRRFTTGFLRYMPIESQI